MLAALMKGTYIEDDLNPPIYRGKIGVANPRRNEQKIYTRSKWYEKDIRIEAVLNLPKPVPKEGIVCTGFEEYFGREVLNLEPSIPGLAR